ncbi:MAG: DUF424 domain-containing protein [Candidatus Asgardarchaeia archaeon]
MSSEERTVYLKIMYHESEIIVAVCDKELIGQEFKEGILRLHVNEAFYKGNLVSINEALNAIERSTIANLVGERIISNAIERGLLHKDSVIYIQGIPHVQIVKVMF